MASCGAFRHIVKQGDTLSGISAAYGVSLADILAVNSEITDPNDLKPEQEICLPSVAAVRESLSYLYGGTTDFYLRLISKTGNSLKTICPDSFEISAEGNLLIASSDKINEDFIRSVHAQKIKITPFLANNWDRSLGIAALDNREKLSSQIVDAVLRYGVDGVNIDIENVTEVYREEYVDFIRRLKEKMPEGKIVSVAVAANPSGWTKGWHGSYDYNALAKQADYLVILAYDESYQGSEEGPVSSSSFFENSIKYALNQSVPKEKIVVAIPFFGRYWKVGQTFGGIGLADSDVENLLKNYESESRFYEATKSAFAQVTITPGDQEPEIWGYRKLTAGTYDIWYDNLDATRFKLSLIDEYDLKGAGSWALGQENLGIWDFYTFVLNASLLKGSIGDMTREETLNFIYPVGSIYMSVNAADPAVLFGGTWVRFASGRTIFAVDENDSQGNFSAPEKSGGETRHRHNFRVAMHWWYGAACGENTGGSTGAYRYSDGRYDGWSRPLDATSMIVNNANYQTRSSTVANPDGKWSLGDTDTAQNFPPYVTCYVWKRTA